MATRGFWSIAGRRGACLYAAKELGAAEVIQRRAKYGNRPLRCRQGEMHQSTLEARRCDELHMLAAGGLVRDLRTQVLFRLDVNCVHICNYIADFVYFDNERGAQVVEDTKGVITETFRLKAKLMEAIHGITVQLVRRSQSWRSAGLGVEA